MGYIGPNEDQWQLLLNYAEQNVKVTMLNLLMYRELADYSEHPNEASCSGEEAYSRYSKLAFPRIQEAGARVLFFGKAEAPIIGPIEERWHEVLLVEYPNVKAFMEMVNSDAYQAIVYHRTAALKDSRLIPIFS